MRPIRRFFLTVILISTFVADPAIAAVFHVPDEYDSIQEAINSTFMDGDTVLVAPGVYFENIYFVGMNITVASYILTTSEPSYIDSTIIDGDTLDCVVSFNNYENDQALLQGFTICNGLQDFGGGIDCQSGTKPQLTDLLVTGNRANEIGGGIYCTWESTPTITNCVVTGNSADEGGGIGVAHTAHPLIKDVLIYENEARIGGGLFCGHGSGECTLDHVYIVDNTADYGGGIYMTESKNNRFINTTISGNRSDSIGGIYLSDSWDYTEIVAVNCIIWDNTLPQIEISNTHEDYISTLQICYSDLEGGHDSIRIVERGEVIWSEGNIDEDPEFVSPEERDYGLTEDSPCIDAGAAFFIAGEDTIIDFTEDQFHGEAPDMGAFEYLVEDYVRDQFHHPHRFLILQNYPNPFNAFTRIAYSVPVLSCVRLALYDISGGLVGVLVDEDVLVGRHICEFDGSDLAAGLYFVRLETFETLIASYPGHTASYPGHTASYPGHTASYPSHTTGRVRSSTSPDKVLKIVVVK